MILKCRQYGFIIIFLVSGLFCNAGDIVIKNFNTSIYVGGGVKYPEILLQTEFRIECSIAN